MLMMFGSVVAKLNTNTSPGAADWLGDSLTTQTDILKGDKTRFNRAERQSDIHFIENSRRGVDAGWWVDGMVDAALFCW